MRVYLTIAVLGAAAAAACETGRPAAPSSGVALDSPIDGEGAGGGGRGGGGGGGGGANAGVDGGDVAPHVFARAPLSERCQAACANGERTVCYACKCKSELGRLPTPEEITCATGDLVPIYRVDADGVVRETKEEHDDCVNPALLISIPYVQACTPGTRVGQMTTEDAIFKWVCRRKPGLPPDATDIYDDMGIIGHNPQTGATCFWTDDVSMFDAPVAGHFPDIDVTDGDPEEVDALEGYFEPAYEGDRCAVCHDNDPFMYSPHLAGVFRFDVESYRSSPYLQVRVDSDPTPVPRKHLVSPEASACTSCHRISDGRTCELWLANATGHPSDDRPFQAEVRAGTYPLAFWMPHPLPASKDDWDARFGSAVDFIEGCCADPSAPGCQWQEMTAPPR